MARYANASARLRDPSNAKDANRVGVWNRSRTRQLPSLIDWCRYARPPKPHWKPGASAFELAREWTSGNPIATLNEWAAASEFEQLDVVQAIAEEQTRFDSYGGGPRNHDLLLHANSKLGRVVVSIEAKVAETFGQRISSCYAYADQRKAARKKTNADARTNELTAALGGRAAAEDSVLSTLRYQLFTGVAGAMAAANDSGARHAVMLIRQYETSRLTDKAAYGNKRDLDRFLSRCFGFTAPDAAQWARGPCTVRGSSYPWAGDVNLWFGFITSRPEPFDAAGRVPWRCWDE